MHCRNQSAGLEHDESLECKYLSTAGGEMPLPARVGPQFLQDFTCLELAAVLMHRYIREQQTMHLPLSSVNLYAPCFSISQDLPMFWGHYRHVGL